MGRHKEFDTDTALDSAMVLFWQRGYAASSMQQLTERMGIQRRSLYDTYGDKHELFLRALQHYSTTRLEKLNALVSARTTAADTIALLLRPDAEAPAQVPGCLIVNTATELGQADAEATVIVDAHLAAERRAIARILADSDGSAATDNALADVIHASWLGIRVSAAAGLDAASLRRTVDAIILLVAERRPA